MRGNIKLASVSIRYEEKARGKKPIEIITRPAEILIVINEKERILKKKKEAIGRVCKELNLNYKKLLNPNINEIKIIKDMGQTLYDI